MSDLSKLSTEELLALRAQAQQQPQQQQQPPQDLSGYSTEDLIALRGRQQQQQQQPHWAVDSLKAYPAGVARGLMYGAGALGDLRQLGWQGANWLGQKAGLPELPAEAPPMPMFPTSKFLNKALEPVTGPLYEAKTTPGRFAQTAGEFTTGVMGPGSMARNVIGGVAIPAVAAQGAYELAPEPYKNIAKTVGGIAGSVIGSLPVPTFGANNNAQRIVADALTPDAPQNFQKLGPQALVADANPTTGQLTQGVAQRPGDASERIRTALTKRHELAPDRLNADVRTNFGPPIAPQRVEARIDNAQSKLNTPYKVALHNSQPAEVAGILSALKTDIAKQAGDPKRALQEISGYFVHGGKTKNTAGDLLAIRHAVDDLYKTPKYQTQPNTLRLIGEYRQHVDDAIAKAAPMVKGVDAKFEQLARQRDSLNQGRNVLNTGKEAIWPSQLATDIGKNSPAQNAALRLGARAEVERVMGTAVHDINAVRGLVKSDGKWNHQKLAQIFGKTEADNVFSAVDREVAFRSLYDRVVTNSQTAPRLLAEQATRVQGPGNLTPETIAAGVAAIGTGNLAAALPAAAATAGARGIAKALASGGQKRLDNALTNILLMEGPKGERTIIDLLAKGQAAKQSSQNATRDMLVRAMLTASSSSGQARGR